MKSLKPIHGSKVISIEEAMKIANQMPTQVVDFLNTSLNKSEYNALNRIAIQYFNEDAHDLFLMPNYNVGIEIEDNHVTYLRMNGADMEYPGKDFKAFGKLTTVDLQRNKMQGWGSLPNMLSLEEIYLQDNELRILPFNVKPNSRLERVYIGNNLIDRSSREYIMAAKRWKDRRIDIII